MEVLSTPVLVWYFISSALPEFDGLSSSEGRLVQMTQIVRDILSYGASRLDDWGTIPNLLSELFAGSRSNLHCADNLYSMESLYAFITSSHGI